MRRVLLDTHIWFWYLTGSDRLPPGLREDIADAEEPPWLSPVSVWELGLLVERGRVELDRSVREWVEDALRELPVEEAVMNAEVALTSHEIDVRHRDPADRFLAATALVFDLTLLTVDERLTVLDWLPTRSG